MGQLALILAVLATSPGASAAASDGHQRFGPTLFALALLVAAAKAGGLLAERFRQPAVLGELPVGIVLANLWPAFGGSDGIVFVRSDPVLLFLAQVGVLILLFGVGLEADLGAFARVGPSSLLVASIGVVVPIMLGWGAAAWLLPESPTVAHVFVGATLSDDQRRHHGPCAEGSWSHADTRGRDHPWSCNHRRHPRAGRPGDSVGYRRQEPRVCRRGRLAESSPAPCSFWA